MCNFAKIQKFLEETYKLLCKDPITITAQIEPSEDYCHYRVKCSRRDMDSLYSTGARSRSGLASIANGMARQKGCTVRISYSTDT